MGGDHPPPGFLNLGGSLSSPIRLDRRGDGGGDMDIGGFTFEGRTPEHEQVEAAGYGSESEYLRYVRGRRCGEASLSVVSRGAGGGGRARGVTSVGSIGSPPSRYA